MNTYAITYKPAADSREIFTAIRFGADEAQAANGLVIDGYAVTEIKMVGEYGGEFCGINGLANPPGAALPDAPQRWR